MRTYAHEEEWEVFADKLSDKSLMKIKNSNGLKIKPWGTPASTFAGEVLISFNVTLRFWSFKKSVFSK